MNFKNFRLIIRHIQKKYGRKKAKLVMFIANRYYAEFQKSIRAVKSKMMKVHVTAIAENCAMYLALKEFYPKQAYLWMDLCIRKRCEGMSRILSFLTGLPGCNYLSMPVIRKIQKEMFGDKLGFRSKVIKSGRDIYQFNMTKCIYCKYCRKFGCEELTRLFCDSDFYMYGNIKGIEFTRTQTLGTGGDCCDFCYKVRK